MRREVWPAFLGVLSEVGGVQSAGLPARWLSESCTLGGIFRRAVEDGGESKSAKLEDFVIGGGSRGDLRERAAVTE